MEDIPVCDIFINDAHELVIKQQPVLNVANASPLFLLDFIQKTYSRATQVYILKLLSDFYTNWSFRLFDQAWLLADPSPLRIE
jgi:hypothetical protein